MGKSYRIRTTPGQDKNIVVEIDQDFEQLEILSLKLRQQDIYLRMCSDYGVIAGRVIANNGFGIPNAKISIFIPVSTEDEENPVISAIYPYKSLEDSNEDGYKFNLLPYIPSYPNHTPTGTFPTRKDALVNQTAVELYDKYYKYTVTTNDSGDYMIFGVPVGSQTLVMNLDLSDIGAFSLAPSDLVRMGVATEEQFNGNKFKSSSNFNELPQIVVINKTIEVVPFWGQPEICQIGITRSDFDITAGANIDIKPTAIFMGSLMSTNEKASVNTKGKSRKETGELCKLITGPGEIIAITQTIDRDINGLPILERAELPNGGKLIDADGTWMFELPMNMDYVITNEFGDQVISTDPNKGIPTRGKYRFKIKWQQSNSLSEDYKRGYYLVPNIRERGWDINSPNSDPLTFSLGLSNYIDAQTSYAFGLNWSSYTSSHNITISNPDIASAVNCEDTFYDFSYNKVYTVSGFIDNFKRANGREKFLGIKRIDDDSCSDTVNRYPVNDGVYHTTILYVITNIILTIIFRILLPFLIIYHIVAFILNLIYSIIKSILCPLCGLKILKVKPFKWICKGTGIDCESDKPLLGPVYLPMITYPDCDACSCEPGNSEGNGVTSAESQSTQNPPLIPDGALTDFNSVDTYNTALLTSSCVYSSDVDDVIKLISPTSDGTEYSYVPLVVNSLIDGRYSTNDLPFGERINIFNDKGKYIEGVNKISVQYEPTNNTNFHYDNVIIVISDKTLSSGAMFTTVNPVNSKDPNFISGATNIYGTNNISGTTIYPQNITITYANPTSRVGNNTTQYVLTSTFTEQLLYQYPSDIEYFQVLTGLTINEFNTISSNFSGNINFNSSFAGLLLSKTKIERKTLTSSCYKEYVITDLIDKDENKVYIIQRGVDPYSPKYNTNIGLGLLFGGNSESDIQITTDLKLNIPIRNTDVNIGGGVNEESMFIHDLSSDNNTPNNGFNLFFPSYVFTPDSLTFSSYTTNFHSYYSQLDSTLNYLINPGNTNTFFHLYRRNLSYNNVKDIFTKTQNDFYWTIPDPSSYDYNESFAGGSYMYRNDSVSMFGYYFSKIYPQTISMTMNNLQNRIVMRSDRLPSSDNITQQYLNNTMLLQQNGSFAMYTYDGGTSLLISGSLGGIVTGQGSDNDDSAYSSVLSSFDCDNMVGLDCYQGDGLNFTIQNPCTARDNVVTYGCYKFVETPLTDLFNGKDIANLSEYSYRFRFFYGLCQGVLSNVFNNNWVNGNLFAYSFKVNTYYNSLNKVKSRKFPTYLVVLHEETNNFYYRSSPYTSNGVFIGSPVPSTGYKGSNIRNLKTPTTILNLGPKDSFLKYLVLNSNFDGYNINNIESTTYKDLSELTNFFAIIRIVDFNFWSGIISNQLRRLFSRPGDKVDADFAQSSAINSQIGILPFDSEYYSTSAATGTPTAVAVGGSSNNIMMGIYFDSKPDDIQVRDYISPVRTIRYNTNSNSFSYDYIDVRSQLIPSYKWKVNPGVSIFGTQTNEWATNSNEIESNYYQKLDRLSSHYPIGGSINPNQYNARGYIFASNSTTIYPSGTTDGLLISTTMQNTTGLGGAPWYFYFGLYKGKSSINRFYTKYIGETALNE